MRSETRDKEILEETEEEKRRNEGKEDGVRKDIW